MSERQTIKTYLREFEQDLHPNQTKPPPADGGLNELDNLLTELKVETKPVEPPPLPEYDNIDSLMAELTVGHISEHQPQQIVAPSREVATAPVRSQAAATTGGGASAHSNIADDLDAIVGNMNFDEEADVSVAFCQHCKGAIGSKEKQLTAFGKKYHPNHFYCNGCKAPMSFGAFYEKGGFAYCDNCFANVLSVKCSSCRSPITAGEYLRVGEQKYHPQCLTCVVCRRAIDHFFLVDNHYYCERDYLLKCAPRCDECSNPIPGKFYSALGKNHHPDCFKCAQCRRQIQNERFFNVGGRAMCNACDPRKLVVTHPEHQPPRLQAATLTETRAAPAPAPAYKTTPTLASEPGSSFIQKRVQLAEANSGSRRKQPLDAESMRTARKARTPEMRRRATEVASERQAQWRSIKAPAWVDSPARGNDMLSTVPGYHLENGVGGPKRDAMQLSIERDMSLYKETMYDVDHDNYIAVNDPEENPVVVSIDSDAVKEDGKKLYRAIVRTTKADTRVVVAAEKKKDRLKALREVMEEQKLVSSETKFKLVKKAEICADLVEFDAKNFKNRFKFGMLFALPDQNDEKKMFANPDGSPAFYAFLDLIAKKHHVEEWKEWKDYNGGLNNQTGKDFYYTTFQDAEVILHVSTLLPFNEADPQKLERKRHLGNDVLLCVFRDAPGPQLSPTMFQSHFNHVFMVVEPHREGAYRINISSKTGVKAHNPPLPLDGVVSASDLRDWFLCKAINAETKAMQSPDFSHALWRTRKVVLSDLIKKYQN